MEQRSQQIRPSCRICGSSSAYVGEKRGYPFHRCSDCQLLFAWPTPSETLEIYKEDYFAGARGGFGYVDYDADKEAMLPTFVRYLQLIERHGLQGRSLLDVGAATGFFLAAARSRGWNGIGVEPSEYACALGRDKGLEMICGVLDDLDPATKRFDVITLWDVLEHVPEPEQAVRTARGLLRPGGLLALNTPDSGSILAKVLGLRWHQVVPPEHIMLFHRLSLERLLQTNGFELVTVQRLGKSFTLQYVAKTLASWQGGRTIKSASALFQKSPLASLAIPLNLYDNIFVLARKADVDQD